MHDLSPCRTRAERTARQHARPQPSGDQSCAQAPDSMPAQEPINHETKAIYLAAQRELQRYLTRHSLPVAWQLTIIVRRTSVLLVALYTHKHLTNRWSVRKFGSDGAILRAVRWFAEQESFDQPEQPAPETESENT